MNLTAHLPRPTNPWKIDQAGASLAGNGVRSRALAVGSDLSAPAKTKTSIPSTSVNTKAAATPKYSTSSISRFWSRSPRTIRPKIFYLIPATTGKRRVSFRRAIYAKLVDLIAPLWIDGQSTIHGRNDRIPLGSANSVCDSLRLFYVGEPAVDLKVFPR